MLKIASFLFKNRKVAQRWELCPQTPYASGGWRLHTPPDPQVSPISLRILRCALYYKRHFRVI